jgi:glycerol-3-phosphate dehydrogenase subunit B
MILDGFDLVVIGAGLSGLVAAAKAAEAGEKVLLVAKGAGAVELSSGCIDLWGYCLDRPDRVCRRPLEEIAALAAADPGHPYAKARDVLEESLVFFRRVTTAAGCPYLENRGENWLLPTALGTVRPTYLAPASMAAASLEGAKGILVVGFRELKDFYPEMLVENLPGSFALSPGCRLRAAVIGAGGGELTTVALARRLERPEVLAGVIGQIKPHLLPGWIVLFPPVLGERRNAAVVRDLAEGLGCPVYEVAGIPPSLPGRRLRNALLDHLKKLKGKVIIGPTVTGAEVSGGRCLEVTASGAAGTLRIKGRAFVLATGSFLGGGLKAEPGGRIVEPVFDLPVTAAGGEWAEEDFFSPGGHPFSRFGITVNERLQPLDGRGRVVIENLLVVGANLAGGNYPVEKCGGGVAVATGYKAGRLAAEGVVR